MHMSLDETGQHGFAAEVGDLSSRTHIGLRTGLVAHIQDALPFTAIVVAVEKSSSTV